MNQKLELVILRKLEAEQRLKTLRSLKVIPIDIYRRNLNLINLCNKYLTLKGY